MKKILYFFLFSFLFKANAQESPLITVPQVDLKKYTGVWYEIASFPKRFQKGCKCTTAEYQLMPDNTVKVINKCTKPDKLAKIEGNAFVVPNSGNSKLKVQFFWPFKSDYWIIELDENYQWAAVGNEDRNSLWILSRLPEMPVELYRSICERLSKKGFVIEHLKRTIHDCKK